MSPRLLLALVAGAVGVAVPTSAGASGTPAAPPAGRLATGQAENMIGTTDAPVGHEAAAQG
ncbi:MAG: hypothetical protein ACRD1K_09535, partial [Acidimicrobiales bacterium]